MSECVVRMDFPDDNCPIGYSFLNIGYCPVEGHRQCDFIDTKERPSWCPIICSLPEGHGDLVDADMPISEIEKYITIWDCHCSEFGDQTVMAVDDLGYLPIVVPAERSEEK